MAISPQHLTLTAATVATFTLDADFSRVEVTNVDGVAALYFTTDGSTPASAQDGCDVVCAVAGASLEVPSKRRGTAPSIVKVISSGIPKVSVRGIPS